MLSYSNVVVFVLLGLKSIAFPNRLRTNIITIIGVLLLNTIPVYSGSEIHKGLKKVLNQEELIFRLKEQKEAIFAALKSLTLLIIILPINGGKTLIFIIPTILQNLGISIIIVLFNTLKKDYI